MSCSTLHFVRVGHPAPYISCGQAVHEAIQFMLHVTMACLSQEVAEPLIFAPHFLRELETLLRAVWQLCPEHAQDGLSAGEVVRGERIIENCCVFDWGKLESMFEFMSLL